MKDVSEKLYQFGEKYPSFEQRNQILDLENEEENNNIEVEKRYLNKEREIYDNILHL